VGGLALEVTFLRVIAMPNRPNCTPGRWRGAVAALTVALAAPAAAQPAPAAPTADPVPAAPDPVAPAPAPPAEPEPEPAPEPGPQPLLDLPQVRIHGFVSEGAFVSTANDYIGKSSRGSLELFEAGLNVSADPVDRLRVGIQLFSRSVGNLRDEAPRIDWAYLDYRWRDWLGMRAGVIKMPFGLYNEYVDIDAARLPILLPQSVYPVRNRDVLLSHTGVSLYGVAPLGGAGELEYQAWLGILAVPLEALDINGATLDEVDSKYVTGGQLFWHPPLEGLRVGATYLRTTIDFYLTLDPATVAALVAAGLVPADYDGSVFITQRPNQLMVASAEYARGDWLFAAEYSRWLKRQRTSLPDLLPLLENDQERFYAMATRRLSSRFEVGGYLSISHADVDDRGGDGMAFAEPHLAFQRDVAATVRYDVNDNWLWKVEAHLMDGAADLPALDNPTPERRWGFFLVRTTVYF
jgi:hypothetical protein